MRWCDKDLETVISVEHPDIIRFLEMMTDNFMMYKKFLERPDSFIIHRSKTVTDQHKSYRLLLSVLSKDEISNANFIMIDGQILKSRWGCPD